MKKEEIINKIIVFLNSNKIGECNIEKKPNGTINFKILETFQIQSRIIRQPNCRCFKTIE